MSETAKTAALRTMTFTHAEVQRRAEQIMQEFPGTTLKGAIGRVFDDLLTQASQVAETEETLSRRLENLDAAQLQIDAANARIAELEAAYAQSQAKVDELAAQIVGAAGTEPFLNLADLPEEQAAYLDNVAKEILIAGIHDSTAEWVLFMLSKFQAAKWYIPSTGGIVRSDWVTDPLTKKKA